jgi:hypothetical protein
VLAVVIDLAAMRHKLSHVAAMLLLLPILAQQAMAGPVYDDAAIEHALSDRTLVYEGGIVQTFHASGETVYGSSHGRWLVRGGSYCSLWPPSDSWGCYRVSVTDTGVQFLDSAGRVYDGAYQD